MLFVAGLLAVLFSGTANAQIGAGNCSLIPGWGPPVDPLATRNEAVFSPGESGFSSLDNLEIVFYNPNKLDFQSATIFSTSSSVNCAPSTNNVQLPNSGPIHAAECYDRCVVSSSWVNFMAGPENFIDDSNPAETLVRGKLNVNNTEELGDIFRPGTPTTRTIISEFPFEITFPTTVSASLEALEVFVPPTLDAALILQSVDVDVTNLNVDGRARILTSLQWPFRFQSGPGSYSVSIISTKNNNPITVSVGLLTECVDPGVVDDSPADNGSVPPCNQVFEVQLTPGTSVCELDGIYRLDFLAECQPDFSSGGSNCPLVGSSGNLENNAAYVVFQLDSEKFCPELIEEVQITASLDSFKDAALTTVGTNYLLGQNIYFLATVTSPKVTLVGVSVQTIVINYAGAGSVLEYDVANNVACTTPAPLGSFCHLVDFVVDDTGADTAQFSFRLTDPPFSPPVDGDQDFDVTVLLDVQFSSVLLLGEDGEPVVQKRSMLLQGGVGAESAARKAAQAGNLEWVQTEDADSVGGVHMGVAAVMGAAGFFLAA